MKRKPIQALYSTSNIIHEDAIVYFENGSIELFWDNENFSIHGLEKENISALNIKNKNKFSFYISGIDIGTHTIYTKREGYPEKREIRHAKLIIENTNTNTNTIIKIYAVTDKSKIYNNKNEIILKEANSEIYIYTSFSIKNNPFID